MSLVILGWLITACALACQGVYVLRTGQTTLFFGKAARSRALAGAVARLVYAMLYLLPVGAIMLILATALVKSGLRRVQAFVIGSFGMIFWSLCFVIIGLLLLAQPEKMLRWTIRANPELADNKSVVVITRFIGVGLLGMGALMLARLWVPLALILAAHVMGYSILLTHVRDFPDALFLLAVPLEAMLIVAIVNACLDITPKRIKF